MDFKDGKFIEVKVKIPRNKIIKISYNRGPGKNNIPAIKFSASWLEDLGYTVGSKCMISLQDDGSILITKYNEIEEPVKVISE